MLPVLAVSGGDLWLYLHSLRPPGFFIAPGWKAAPIGSVSKCRPRMPPYLVSLILARDRVAMGERWFRQDRVCEFAANE